MKVYNRVTIEKFNQCKYGLNICNLIVQLEMAQYHTATSFCTETDFLILFFLCVNLSTKSNIEEWSYHKVLFSKIYICFKKKAYWFSFIKKNRYLPHLVSILHSLRCLQVRDVVALPFCNLISLKKAGVRARVCICTWENGAQGFQQSSQGQKWPDVPSSTLFIIAVVSSPSHCFYL